MKLNVETLGKIAGKPVNSNMRSILSGLDAFGTMAGLDQPHRLAHYIAQLGHESGGFHYDREVWGPTPAQKGYEGRKDLGNTQPGDGKKFSGKGPIQITGRANTAAFRDWCRAGGFDAPDFERNPELINTDPWEGLGPLWYWMTGNPTKQSLNAYADKNDIEMITRRINGGANGLADRIDWYVRAALVLAGFGPTDVEGFQAVAQRRGLLPADEPGKPSQLDGIPGPKTRSALHMRLVEEATGSTAKVAAAPIVAEVATPVVPAGVEKVAAQRTWGGVALLSPILAWFGSLFAGLNQTGVFILLGVSFLAVVYLLWRGERIASRARAVIAAFGGETQ